MKLLTFEHRGHERVGGLRADGIVDLTADGGDACTSMQRLIDGGDDAWRRAEQAIAGAAPGSLLDPVDVTWCSPLPVPAQLRDCLGFEEHLKNTYVNAVRLSTMGAPDPEAAFADAVAAGRTSPPPVWYQQPLYYKANRFACSGHLGEVAWPTYSTLMDFELELACVVGRRGRDIPRESALDHVFGYTIFNDLSARDAQVVEMPGMLGPAKGKDFDGSNVLGPVIVTRDEISDPYALAMRARVNGELLCDGSSSTMHWRFEDMIRHISAGETLHPGEVIASGTVGWGSGMEHGRFLQSGDVVELEIEGIGCLRTTVRSVS